ncbi:hypothetical protein [Klebsiella pneumoniae]|uniref:hypothetical protein n=1 Tax=Klebsiella pneumoniae TaxID=573 RepID=UPI00374F0996
MTSKLSRERLEKIKSWRETYGAGSNVILPAEEAEELARIALATMDGEPAAWTWHYREQWHVTNDERRAEFVAKDGDVAVLPLYRHAQSAQISEPVLPLQDKDLQGVIDALEHPAGINAAGKQVVRHALVEIQERRKADSEPVAEVVSIYGDPEAFGEREIRPLVGIQQMPYGTKLYRHAQPAPVVPEDFDFNRFNDVVWLECVASNPHMHSPTTSAIARVALELNKRSATMETEPDRNPVLAYADSYRDMAKQGVESVPIWSVITDLERNIAPLYSHAQPVPVTEREPIAWLNDAYLARGVVDGEAGSEDAGPGYIPVYREAQPAPVVPDGYVMVPINMTTEQMRAVQRDSTLGTFASAHLKGAFDLYREFWSVAVAASPQEFRKSNVVGTYRGADGKEHEIIYLTSSQKELK